MPPRDKSSPTHPTGSPLFPERPEEPPAGPYFVHHPAPEMDKIPTIVFIPGGAGLRRNAQRVWESYLSGEKSVASFRIIVPYSANLDFLEEFARTFAILDEVLACHGGDPENVHVAGVSNGGLAAFALMLQRPQRFKTLLGAPGEFPKVNPAEWARALQGKSVFNGVGEHDDNWKPEVKEPGPPGETLHECKPAHRLQARNL